MIARTLLAVLSSAYGETDPAVLDTAKKPPRNWPITSTNTSTIPSGQPRSP